MESLFKDRVRERDLDNFLVEELHASLEFRDWLISRISAGFSPPGSGEVRLHKSPSREQDVGQTDVRMGWFDADGDMIACVLIESKVTEEFQPGQADSYALERAALRRASERRAQRTLRCAPILCRFSSASFSNQRAARLETRIQNRLSRGRSRPCSRSRQSQ